MNSIKKHKIILGTCIPAAALGVAAGVTGIVLATRKTDPVVPFDPATQIKVTFDAGTGAFEENATTTKIVDKNTTLAKIASPVVQKAGFIFAGWKNSATGQMQRDDVILTTSTNLVATYSDETPGISHVIKFQEGTTGATLSGNISVAIASGKHFVNVNRPTAEKANSVFSGWIFAEAVGSHAKGDAVKETDPVEADWVLEPSFIDSKQVTFSTTGKLVDESAGTTTGITVDYVGSSQPYYALQKYDSTQSQWVDTTWADVNKPEATAHDHSAAYLEGYYTDAECTTANKITDATLIKNLPTTIYVKFTTAPTTLYCIMHAGTWDLTVVPTLSGNTAQAVLRTGVVWSGVNKPTATLAGYKLSDWEWTDTDPTGGTTPSWTKASVEAPSFDKANLYIRPVMTPTATAVLITGSKSAIVGQSGLKYQAYVRGSNDDNVTFAVQYYDGSNWVADTDGTYASVNITQAVAQGIDVELTVKDKADATAMKRIRLAVTSSIGAKEGYLEVELSLPTANSNKVWYHDSTDHKWFGIELSELTKSVDPTTGKITICDVNGTSYEVLYGATLKTQALNMGDLITEIPDNFLAGNSAFEGTINLNNVTVIKDNFMAGCTAFNQTIDFSKIKTIGDGFMNWCDAFNKEIALTVCESIGDDFLFHCDAFTSAISFPAIKTIGKNFLEDCIAFAADIELPSTLTAVGEHCMYGCKGFTGAIKVECAVTAIEQNMYSFCGFTTDDVIYKTGFTVTGTNADDFKAAFAAIADTTHGVCRSYAGEASEVTISGADSITIDTAQAKTETYTETHIGPTGLTTTWEVDSTSTTATGCTIDPSTGVVTVATNATAGNLVIKLTIGGQTVSKTIEIKAA